MILSPLQSETIEQPPSEAQLSNLAIYVLFCVRFYFALFLLFFIIVLLITDGPLIWLKKERRTTATECGAINFMNSPKEQGEREREGEKTLLRELCWVTRSSLLLLLFFLSAGTVM